ncbi:MAG: V-type ATPase subunit [Candidatus Sumerlaeota bacterium]|nr:V-type ATPase subunit [Candidatus Sumerlaeota bacterium]
MTRLPDIMRSKAEDRHLYAVGRVRVLENRLLDRDIIRDLVEADTLKDVFSELRDTVYGEEVVETEETLDFERMLSLETRSLINLIDSISPDPELTDLFVFQFDIQNLKMLFKSHLCGAPEPDSFYTLGRFDLNLLRQVIKGEGATDLPAWIVEAGAEVREAWKKSPNLRIIDAILDRALTLAQLAGAEAAKRPVLINYFRHLIDTANVDTFVRIRISGRSKEQFEQFFIPNGELPMSFFKNTWETNIRELGRIFEHTPYNNMVVKSLEEYQTEGTLTMLEVEKTHLLMEQLTPARYITFGPEPIIAYMVTRLYEIGLIRLIMVAKKNSLPLEDLRKRVMTYHV